MLSLREPRDEKLERSPLKLVVCQVRHTKKLAVTEPQVGLGVQQALGGQEAWRLDEFARQVLELEASPAGVSSSSSAGPEKGWRLVSEDETRTATVLPSSVGYETNRYESWIEFSREFHALLRAVHEAIAPPMEQRLGLRYVDRIDDPRVSSPTDLGRWIRPEVLGLIQHPGIGPGITAVQQQVDIEVDRQVRATIRHGCFTDKPSGTLVYVMDFDTYRVGNREFNVDTIMADLDRLHRLALQLFQEMITPELYNYLRGGG